MKANKVVDTTKKRKLTLKQKKFTKVYLETGNATEAAEQAYNVDKKTASVMGSQNLRKLSIKEEIDAAIDELGINPRYVLSSIQDTIERCKQAKPVLNKKGEQVYCENPAGDIVPAYRFDPNNILKGSELLGKHLKLFTDTIDVNAKVEATIEDSDRKKELAKKLLLSLQNPDLLGSLDF